MFQALRTTFVAACFAALWAGSACARVVDEASVLAGAGGVGGTDANRAGASNRGGAAASDGGSPHAGTAGWGDAGSSGLAEAGSSGLPDPGVAGAFSGCSELELACGPHCVEPHSDTLNCGGCGNACANSQSCINGSCVQQCPAGLTVCDGRCIDTHLDGRNCGACDHACGSGQACVAGGCCRSTFVCNGACVDLENDAANCGLCGHACADGETCVIARCGPPCELPARPQCGLRCSDLQTDSANCGGCANDCGPERACRQGACACGAGTTWYNGHCIDTQNDPANCGLVTHACGYNQVCSQGKCGCRPGTTSCDGICRDTSISQFNCGACGARCATSSVCTYGLCEAPSSDWPTFGYNVARSGENTVETGKPPLTFAWEEDYVRVRAPNYPVLSGGQLYVTHEVGHGLYAFSVSDGFERWYAGGFRPAPGARGMPSVFDNTIYLVDNREWPGLMALFAIGTRGEDLWHAPLPDAPRNLGVPLRVGATVFTNAGTAGGLYGFDAGDGAQKFLQPLEPAYDSWSAAYFSGRIYTFAAGHFRAHDPQTGAILSQLDLSWTAGEKARAVPVFGANRAFVVTPPSLVAIDPALNAVAWAVSDAYTGTPAVSANSVFAISAGKLVVRDTAGGNLQWTFAGDSQLSYPPVIANGYVYVASDENLYALDISTHFLVDHKPIGGWLIVANHRLIVAPKDKFITAYVLSK